MTKKATAPTTLPSGQINGRISREADSVKCHCGGFAERVDCTHEEIVSSNNCGRDYECCCRAFVCAVCNQRLVGMADSPEME